MKKLLIALLITGSVYGQNYELYTGSVLSEDKSVGYLIGVNFIIKTDQNREYLNDLLLGFEHSAYMSGTKITGINKETVSNGCNCTSEALDFRGEKNIKKETRAVSLNFGVNICKTCWLKQLYLISGVTNYQHITVINENKASEYRTVQIDAGAKYFWKTKKSFLTTTFKFNPETVSFGLGYSR